MFDVIIILGYVISSVNSFMCFVKVRQQWRHLNDKRVCLYSSLGNASTSVLWQVGH